MGKNYLRDVAKLCSVEENEIASIPQWELVENYILPRAVEVTGQDTRGWRISPNFMQFMADWGQYCVKQDLFTGELLMEIAMQRLSRGAIVRNVRDDEDFDAAIEKLAIQEEDSNEVQAQKRATRAKMFVDKLNATAQDVFAAYNPWYALPAKYRKYSNWYDQPGLMDQECWNFVKQNLYFCMALLTNKVWAGHAQKLCIGLLTHISCKGEVMNYTWNESLVNESLEDVYKFSEELACRFFGVDQVAAWLMPNWRVYKIFFKKHENEIDFTILFEDWESGEEGLNFAKEGEYYFGKNKRKLLKLLGQYKKAVVRKVRKEMMSD